MKKHRVTTVVLSMLNLMLAWYLDVEFQFLWGIDLPSGITQAELNSLRLQSNIHNTFLASLMVLSMLVVIGIVVRRNWGRILAFTQCVIFIMFSVYIITLAVSDSIRGDYSLTSVLSYPPYMVLFFCIGYSVSEWIYLTRPSVREIFKPLQRQISSP